MVPRPLEQTLLEPGNPLAMGANPVAGAVEFSIFSRHATRMILCLYARHSDAAPVREYSLDPSANRTGDIWHCRIRGIGPGALYLWRAEGPFLPMEGLRFNPGRVLIDPYAKALTHGPWDISAARAYGPSTPGIEWEDTDLGFASERNDGSMPKCVVVEDTFDWRGDRPLNYPLKDCVIYETHVRGLTCGAHAQVRHPGTYRGVTEMIPHFKRLGITSIEFLPIQEFASRELFRKNPLTGEELTNYWGYSPLAFFAPKASYAHPEGARAHQDPARHVHEFKRMVRELHAAGLEVILDVVFNHTAEGNEMGPTVSFRGLDNPVYYMLEDDRRHYKNYSGCGNTLNCNHPITRTLIQDCLRYWVVTMHVDGFRFDLGSILGRNAKGELLENPPVIESIAEDPLLRETKIIAEAWDAGGAYQVGSFPGGRWAEWNDRFRDDVRKFWRGDATGAIHLATRITGSSDLYLRDGRKPFHSINFITAHDGFTLNDLLSYTVKRNEANGEDNRDGSDANLSMNCGAEGDPAPDAPGSVEVAALRTRQIKNFLSTLLLSIGTPMILGGDEFRRSQRGNNNAYCQDNEISWYDWTLAEKNSDLVSFVAELVRFRMLHPSFRRPEFFTGEDTDLNDMPDITWFDEDGLNPDWTTLRNRIAARIDGSRAEHFGDRDDADFYLMFNGSPSSVAFEIPAHPRGRLWTLALDTALPSPRDIATIDGNGGPLHFQSSYALAANSLVVLMTCP